MIYRTWPIRDQMPDGKWGPERCVTLEQYRAELTAAHLRAIQAYRANVERLAMEARR